MSTSTPPPIAPIKAQESFFKKLFKAAFKAFCIVVLLIVAVIVAGVFFMHVDQSSPLAPPPVVTKAEYDQIATGMTYEQVKQIIGAPGEENAHDETAGFVTVSYQWMNSNGSNMNAMFQNGKLVSKAQAGLP